MIEVRNVQPGQNDKDLLVFETYIPSIECLLINLKLRLNKNNKPYVVFPCMVVDQPDGTKKYPMLVQFGGKIGEALKTQVIPQLRNLRPDVFSRFE